MAYIDPNQEDQDKLQGQGAPAENNPEQAPSTAGAVGAPDVQQYNAQQPTTGTRNTGFQNLNTYLDANQGNTLSTQLAGKVQTQADKAQQDLQEAQQGFKGAVDQNTVNYDQDNAKRVLDNPANSSAEDTAKFKSQLNANYQGPKDAQSFGSFSNAQNSGRNAYNSAQSAKTEGGKLALLDSYFGTPTYTQGQKSLDSALVLGGDQTAFNHIQDEVQNFPSQFQTAAQELGDYAGQGASKTSAAKNSARQALGIDDAGNPVGQGAIQKLSGSITDRIAADKVAQDAAMQKFLSHTTQTNQLQDSNSVDGPWVDTGGSRSHFTDSADLNNLGGVTDPNMLQRLGVTQLPNDAAGIPWLKDYVSRSAIDESSVTSPEEAAKMNALYSLAGSENPTHFDSSRLGSYQQPLQVDQGGFTNALQSYMNTFPTNTGVDVNRTDLEGRNNIGLVNQIRYILGMPQIDLPTQPYTAAPRPKVRT